MHLRSAMILCLAFVVVACGGGSDAGIGLRLDDFPSGWTQYGTEGDESTCESVVAVKKAATDYDRSPQFEHRGGMVATSTVFVYRDEAAARKAFATLTGDTTAKCLATSLGTGQATPFDVAAVGDEHAGLQAAVAATQKIPGAVFQLVFVRAGSGVAELVLAGVSKPFDAHLREDLTAQVAERLEVRRP